MILLKNALDGKDFFALLCKIVRFKSETHIELYLSKYTQKGQELLKLDLDKQVLQILRNPNYKQQIDLLESCFEIKI